MLLLAKRIEFHLLAKSFRLIFNCDIKINFFEWETY